MFTISPVLTTFAILLFILGFHRVCVFCFTTNGVIWNKAQQEFVGMYTVPEFSELRNEILKEDGTLFDNNLNRREIRIGYYEEKNWVVFLDNHTRVTGVFGDMWHLLADYLNFTLVPVYYAERDFGQSFCNGSYTGLLGLLQQNKIDAVPRAGVYTFHLSTAEYIMPVWKTRYVLYTRPQYKADNNWLITLLAPTTWYCVLCLLIMLGIVGYVLQSLLLRSTESNGTLEQFSLFEHIFYTFALMCAQGYVPATFYNRYKILSLSKSVFAWLTLLTFSSQLIYRMTNRMLIPPFSDITSLFNSTKFNLIVFKGSMVFEAFKKEIQKSAVEAKLARIEDRVEFVVSSLTMYTTACFHPKIYAMFEVEDRYWANGRYMCTLIPVGRSYYDTWVASAIPRRSPFKKVFSAGIIKLHETGLLKLLRLRYFNPGMKSLVRNTFTTIDIDQVRLMFFILLIGMFLSLLLLVLERIKFIYDNNRTN